MYNMGTFEKMLSKHDATIDDLKSADEFCKWEISAMERGEYGKLRLSTAVKAHRALGIELNEIINALGEATREKRDYTGSRSCTSSASGTDRIDGEPGHRQRAPRP